MTQSVSVRGTQYTIKHSHGPGGEFVPCYAHKSPVSLPTVHGLGSLVDIRLLVETPVEVYGIYQH